MTDNFQLIKNLLDFPTETTFYFVQIIARKKDNPNQEKATTIKDNFFLRCADDLDRYKEKIIERCADNARAYINLNKRCAERVGIEATRKAFDLLVSKQFFAIKNVYTSACGEVNSDTEKKWIIDLDEVQELAEVRASIESIRGDAIVATIPTVSGLHLITKGFDSRTFIKQFPEIEIKKDAPTILYADVSRGTIPEE